MAVETYKVKKGDTLTKIAKTYKSTIGSKLTLNQRIQRLCDLNDISNKDKLVVGQVLKLNGTVAKSKTSSTKTATITVFGLQADTDSTVFAKWSWSKSHTDHYATVWYYKTSDGQWFKGNESDVTDKESTYSAPSNAVSVKFQVKPVSKTHKVKNKDTAYWTAGWSTAKVYDFSNNPPTTPGSAPTVAIEKYTLTAEVSNLNVNGSHIQFQIVKDDTSVFKTGMAAIKTGSASYSVSVTAGSEYKVRCRTYREKDKEYSDWTEYSSNVSTIPATPTEITNIQAKSDTSIYLKWAAVKSATSYDIEYSTEKDYFDKTDQTQTKTGIEFTEYIINGLESGLTYYFRVRATNSAGSSGWSGIKYVVIGKEPAAPTTWSSTTTCITGEELVLYWVHNSEDGSSQVRAELQLTINGTTETKTITNSTDEEEKDKTSSYVINTTSYTEGTIISWKVRTCGITGVYGDWSIERTIDVYAPPTLELSMTDVNGDPLEVLTSYPFYIYGIPGPRTQAPIGYHLTITSNNTYETIDQIGNTTVISAGEEIYSKYFDITEALLTEFSASSVDLENNMNYTVTCVVSMNSGLTAKEEINFLVNWEEKKYSPNAEISYDSETYVTHIMPYCEYFPSQIHTVNYDETTDIYTVTDTIINDPKGVEVEGAFTEYGYPVYTGTLPDGSTAFYCFIYQHTVYKATFDSSVTEYEKTDEVIDDPHGMPVTNLYTDEGEQIYMSSTVVDEETNITYYYFSNETPILINRNDYDRYTKTTEVIDDPKGICVDSAFTETGDQIYSATLSDGTTVYYYIVEQEKAELVSDVTLSVYRREYDGSFVELATGLINTKNTFITDPHPALDYARYRIVAIESTTGAVSYYDLPGYPTGETAVIIQWNEEWSTFDPNGSKEEDELAEPAWSGSLLRLPYNIDVSDKYSPDTSLIEYIGRKRPVSYYGTQLGESSSWKVDIIKEDEDTLYALRRLAIWMGDVYVREPSGSGYWAQIKVSFTQSHDSLVIPVNLDITRVEGTEEVIIETK